MEAAGQSGDRVYVYVAHVPSLGLVSRRAVRRRGILCGLAQARAHELGEQLVNADMFAAVNAEIALGAGRVQEAIDLAAHAVAITQEMGGIFCEGLARRVWGQALAALAPPA